MPHVLLVRIAIMLGLWLSISMLPQSTISLLPQTFAHTKSDLHVQRIKFPVTVLGEQHTIAGVLYVNPSQHKICSHKTTPRKVEKCFLKLSTLQVLVHGWTYNHTYWDPYGAGKPGRSYARFMAKKGYVVLALDLDSVMVIAASKSGLMRSGSVSSRRANVMRSVWLTSREASSSATKASAATASPLPLRSHIANNVGWI